VMNLGYIAKTLENITPLVTETIFVCGALAVIAVAAGVGRARAGGLPLMALFGYAAFRIVPAANRITWQINRVRSAGPAVDSLYDDYLLLTGSTWGQHQDDHGNGLVFHDRIVFDHVTYSFPNTRNPALNEVCLTISHGESVAIVGHTGAGKTTLVDLVVGLLRPSSGSILVDGVDLNDHLNSWRRWVGYVPQEIFLTDDSLRRNIALGIDDQGVDERRVVTAVQMAQLERLVAGLPRGLDSLLGERGARLSGGERQRVGIARALYHDPDLLVFDEATSALDLQTETALNAAMEALRGRKTLLVVAHRLSSVRRCDRVIFLVNGRIKGCGSYDELLDGDPEFRRFAMAQERVNPAFD
jgi:ATP-binding cassette, subfamily B, bacterial PglK